MPGLELQASGCGEQVKKALRVSCAKYRWTGDQVAAGAPGAESLCGSWREAGQREAGPACQATGVRRVTGPAAAGLTLAGSS